MKHAKEVGIKWFVGARFDIFKTRVTCGFSVHQTLGQNRVVNIITTQRACSMSEGKEMVDTESPENAKESSRPAHLDFHHQDGVFSNTFQAKPCFVVHPEWLSEDPGSAESVPLTRPPWPWEQPRYRVNLQTPITYQSPAEMKRERPSSAPGGGRWTPSDIAVLQQCDYTPLDQMRFRNYTFTHPCPEEAAVLHCTRDIHVGVPQN